MELIDLAFELSQEGNYQKALYYYDEILKKDPRNIKALIDKGVTLQTLGKLKNSLACYNKALVLDPDNVDAFIN